MFYELLDCGHDPRKIDYKDLAMDWIKQNILKKYDLDCNEINWIENTVSYFYKNARRIWKQHKGRVTGLKVQNQHSKFLDLFIDATHVDACKCIKCYVLETRIVESSRDDEFSTEKALNAHENVLHQVASLEKSTLEYAERYLKKELSNRFLK